MEEIGEVLKSPNGIAISIIILMAVVVLLFFAQMGYFSFKGKGLSIGKTEGEVRAVLLKQKEFLLQYCSYLTLMIISDMKNMNIETSYVNVDYVIEKVVDEWLGWLLVNHVTMEESYINLKTQQSKLIMLKAIGRVNPDLLQKSDMVDYFNGICEKITKEIISGIINVYKLEKR